ncbi:hypothetical protein [Halopseudomonas laoshanensis]|uniref:hypothetical protein n=1 Tax=Halopseudomonas laoshanensis TaxID=2268758 RepID=UPI003735FD4F
MPRNVDVGWYEKYLRAKEMLENKSENPGLGSVAAIAKEISINPRTLHRMMAGGRYLDRVKPEASEADVACSYVALETLEKISRLSQPVADDLLAGALANSTGISELKQILEKLKIEQPALAHEMNVRAAKRQNWRALIRKLDVFTSQSGSDFFGVHNGTVLRANRSVEYDAPRYVVLDEKGSIHALVFTKIGGESRSALAVALELYDLAVARHAGGLNPAIWIVFLEESEVMHHLAEIALWAGGSPFNGNWLFLAHTFDHQGEVGLRVLFEHEFSAILADIGRGRGRVAQAQLLWSGAEFAAKESTLLNVGYTPSLPTATSDRRYYDVLIARLKEGNKSPTSFYKGLLFYTGLGI